MRVVPHSEFAWDARFPGRRNAQVFRYVGESISKVVAACCISKLALGSNELTELGSLRVVRGERPSSSQVGQARPGSVVYEVARYSQGADSLLEKVPFEV
ncbi:hypothetical protein ERJ75_000263400 [Trypanosoma vivax]|nr:hypothetical protein ERJ75_000263400 [Trypanosoma vivax]